MTDTLPRPVTAGSRWNGLPFRGRRWRAGAAGASAGFRDDARVDAREFVYPLAEGPLPEPASGSGARLCRHLDLYHDGDAAALACTRGHGRAVTLTCGPFGGSYVSLVAGVPDALSRRFGPGRVLRLVMDIGTTRPLTAFVRLNVGSADGHETFYETLVVDAGVRAVAFDLDAVRLPYDCRLRAWADVIFSRPADAGITVSDLRIGVLGKHEV